MIAGYCWPQSVLPGEAVSVAVSAFLGNGCPPNTLKQLWQGAAIPFFPPTPDPKTST